tara:strand:+ start:1852 stop:2526 length:675 start_codon:yes stop_codon:yes gene_type:complete
MRVDADNKQRIKAALAFGLEFYKVLMGTFLTAFVPRVCDDSVCTVSQNIYDDELFHRIAISFNAFSFLTFLAFYYTEIRREEWCIQYLDIDPDKANENLDDEIEQYPELKEGMAKLNKSYADSTKFCGAVQLVNIGLSLGDISSHWAGGATLTPLLSYILLIFMKLSQAYNVSSIAVKDERAFSAFITGPKTYNTIDEDHRRVEITEEEPSKVEEVEVIIENDV